MQSAELEQLRIRVAQLEVELELERQKRLLAEAITKITQGLSQHSLKERR